MFSRRASEHIALWPRGVVAIDGSTSDEQALQLAMRGCDAVVHLAGIVSERGSSGTLEEVNVEGTRHVVNAADRAGVRRLVYVSSLGAERGTSLYHQSKLRAEELTRRFPREWLVLRPGNVYGPGDEVISLLFKMVRSLPVVPAIDGGGHAFQPVWVEDLAEALAHSVEREELQRCSLDLAGPDRTSMNDLIERFSSITGRSPTRVPVPGFLSVLGARAAGMLGLHVPVDAGQIQMLEEGNVIPEGGQNALMSVFGIPAMSLDQGLRRLADSLPEKEITEGVGSITRRYVWVDIVGSKLDQAALFERFRAKFGEITPWHVGVGVEPGTSVEPRFGATLTMHLPLRGNVQVRVVELTSTSLTLATVEGHPLAGLVRFRLEARGEDRMRFHVEVHDRPANIADWLVMSTVGGALQVVTWRDTVEHLLAESGGQALDGVHDESASLRGAEAREVETWAASLLDGRKRALHEQGLSDVAARAER